MNDLISRQAAIDAVCSVCGDTECNIFDPDNKAKLYCPEPYAIMKLPPAEPQWIPVSKMLPKIGKEVLLSEPNAMFISEYHGSGNPEGLWLVDGLHHYLADVNGCAWMPIPKPYKAGDAK